MAEFSEAALKAEIINDPELIGYKNVHPSSDTNDWKGDQVIADLINAKNLFIDRIAVEMEAIRSATEFDWYDTLSIDEQEYMRWLTPDDGSWKVTASMKLILTGRTLTNNGVAGTGADGDGWWAAAHDQDAAPAMLALIEVPGSRGEVLWDEGRSISAGQVGGAAKP